MDRAGGRGCCACCRAARLTLCLQCISEHAGTVSTAEREGLCPAGVRCASGVGTRAPWGFRERRCRAKMPLSALPLRLGRSLPFPASCFSYLRNGDKETVVRSARHGRLCRLLTSVFPAHHAKGRVASEWRLVNPDSPSRAAAAKGKGETKGQLHPEGRTTVLRTRLKAGPWPFPVQPVLCLALT